MSEKVNRLGRGLDALIPTKLDEFVSDEVSEVLKLDDTIIQQIPVDKIVPNPFQPRKDFDEVTIRELADSIKQHGILQPLILTRVGREYQLIAGERRWRAAQEAGLKTIPAIIRSLHEQEHLEVAVVENIQRTELNLIELALSYRQLSDQFNMSGNQIAEKVGKSAATVSNVMRLLNLPYSAKRALQDGQIAEGHARTILSISDEKQQERLLKMIIDNDMTVRQAEELARNFKADKQLDSPRVKQAETAFQSITDSLGKHLGTKVTITKNAKGGKVNLRFYSEEELGRIYQQITGEPLL